jgi:hypothetical protein
LDEWTKLLPGITIHAVSQASEVGLQLGRHRHRGSPLGQAVRELTDLAGDHRYRADGGDQAGEDVGETAQAIRLREGFG